MHLRTAVALAVLLWTASAYARDPYKLSIWVRNNTTSINTFNTNHQGTMTEVNPTWYYLSDPAAGPVRIVEPPGGIPGGLQPNGALLIPTIRNIINGSGDFSPLPTNWILENQDQHAADIKALLDANPHYAGIELDYERMAADTEDPAVIAWRKDAFSSLVEKIKAQIGSKILSVCVYRKRDVDGSRDSKNSRVQDWARLTGPYGADYIKVMMYTDISSTSNELVKNDRYRAALAFGQQQVTNRNKLVVALPWYGAKVSVSPPVEGTPPPRGGCCDSRNNSGELLYWGTDGAQWVVLDEQATREKILIALNEFDVGGFAFWESGRIVNWPEVWETIRGRIDSAGATVRAVDPPFCPTTPYPTYIDWANTTVPAGATYRFDWYQWGFSTGNYTWKATGDPSSPGLSGGSFMVRIHGVVGRRVYEAESPMFTITCRTRP